MTDVTRRPGGTPLTEGTPRTTSDTDRGTDRDLEIDRGTDRGTGIDRGTGSPSAAAHPRPGGTLPGTGAEKPVPTASGAPGHTRHDGEAGGHHRLLPHDDTDQLAAQLQHAVAGFVDAPRDAVQEADQVLRELAERFTDAVTERRRTLRRSWQTADAGTAGPGDGQAAAATDTEQLRLALRDYRELAERLLHV
ncbi:hypothetical protein AB0O72_05070 [Streptomyces sp. NPDC088106]|uniref:hypothetical protein n=1 Tax=unclassified Streptomyces TaxID=2593676 RepID=UPI003425D220